MWNLLRIDPWLPTTCGVALVMGKRHANVKPRKSVRDCWLNLGAFNNQSCARGPENAGAKRKSFMLVPINSGNRSGSCSENCGFRIAQVVGCHSKNGISYSENGISNCSENTPELSESSENDLFTPRAFFLKWGVVPRLLNQDCLKFMKFSIFVSAAKQHLTCSSCFSTACKLHCTRRGSEKPSFWRYSRGF